MKESFISSRESVAGTLKWPKHFLSRARAHPKKGWCYIRQVQSPPNLLLPYFFPHLLYFISTRIGEQIKEKKEEQSGRRKKNIK